MIKIRLKNGDIVKITKKEYEAKFKNLGYPIVEEETRKEEDVKQSWEEQSEQREEESEQNNELESIPISEMNKSQLLLFAKQNDIDMTGVSTVSEARKRIQRAIRNRKM